MKATLCRPLTHFLSRVPIMANLVGLRSAVLHPTLEKNTLHRDVPELSGFAPLRYPDCGGRLVWRTARHSIPNSAAKLCTPHASAVDRLRVDNPAAAELRATHPRNAADVALASLPTTCPVEAAAHHDFRWLGNEAEHLRCSLEFGMQ